MRNRRKYWRKTLMAHCLFWSLRQYFGACTFSHFLHIFNRLSSNFQSRITMDCHTISVQQARAASFLTQMLPIMSKLSAPEKDDSQSRIKSKFQQRLHWDAFVQKYNDKPFFQRHLQMSYNYLIKFGNAF